MSVSTNTCPFAELNPPEVPAGKLERTNGNEYWNLFESITFDTLVDILSVSYTHLRAHETS